MTRPRQTITHLHADQLTTHPANVRDELGDLTDLARSIREHGILQPITVTEHDAGGYLIIAGHRRLGAGLMAGLTSFPAVIRHGLDDPAEQLVVMLVENTQRRDLNPVERAQAYGALINRGLNQSDIARRVGCTPATVNHYLTLLELDDESLDLPVIVERTHFGAHHPLIAYVSSICGHTTRPKVGNSMCCGQCWEAVIRADALSLPMPEPEYDEAVVQRIVGGSVDVHAAPCERAEVVRRWRAAGKSLAELERRTGWKVDRYTIPEPREAAS